MSEKRFTVEETDSGDFFFIWDNETHTNAAAGAFGTYRKAQAKADRLNARTLRDQRSRVRNSRTEWMDEE